MTKIPVWEACDSLWKVKTTDELIEDAELELKRQNIKNRKQLAILAWIFIVYLAVVSLNGIMITSKLLNLFYTNPEQAQCESIGGRYDGQACWYNGSKVDVNKYVEEWK